MKPIAILFVSTLLLMSCTSLFNQSNFSNHFYDEFKQKNTFVLKQMVTPEERNSNIQNEEFEYLIHNDSIDNDIRLFINLRRNIASQPIENQLYIKLNASEIHKITLKVIASKPQERNIVETATNTTVDTAGVSHTTENTSNRLMSWNDDTYEATIPFEIVEKMKRSHAITLRLYSGAMPATFVLNNSKMEKFNCFVNQEIPLASQ